MRTCVGCRQRDDRSVLLRVVAVESAGSMILRPDDGCSLPGRGAWVHPRSRCFEQAQRRRAFGRALRLAGALDTTQVQAFVEALQQSAFGPSGSEARQVTESGFDADESPMSTQQ
ncbi:YlxR family protein [Gephyromycinifex aptenodytis]|uniref:YlxR family protein n=1 Tax=Gephyromycinifex aptenodytis TaxID=2716227 RepID=UPI001D01051A|nr:YlxR family protein [Gephyromycinifex aptenodytis]